MIAARRKRRRVDDHIRCDLCDGLPQPIAAFRILQAGREHPYWPGALACEFGYQAVDGVGVGSRQNRTIKYNQHDWCAVGREVRFGRLDHAGAGNIESKPRQRGARDWWHRWQACGERKLCQSRARRIRSAAIAKRFQAAQGRGRQVRGGIQTRIGAAVAGNDRERDTFCRRECAELFDAVTPIVNTAEQADQDAARARQGVLEIQIDRERMRQLTQVGQSKTRQGLAATAPGGREGAEIAVRKGQHDQVRRGLAEILGGRCFLESMPFPQQDVHALPRKNGGNGVAVEAALADHDDP